MTEDQTIRRAAAAAGCRLSGQDLGGDRARTATVTRVKVVGEDAVLKIAGPDLDPARLHREADVLQWLEAVEWPHAPRLIDHSRPVGPHNSDRHWLLMTRIPGRPGCGIRGLDDLQIRSTLEAMTSLHALCLTPENRVLSLPEWGQGRGTGRDRHERRVRRYRSRCSGFLKNIEQRGAFGGVDDSGLRHLMDVVDERLESDLEELAGLGTSLIHADLHAENLVFNGESVSILDWQTCSYGPIVYETVRFLAESLRGPDAFDRFESELAAHKMLMTQRGFPDDVLSTLETSIERCLRVSFAGMVSGYGRLGAVSKHDATIAWWLASDGGLAEIMKRRFLLDITLTAPPDCT